MKRLIVGAMLLSSMAVPVFATEPECVPTEVFIQNMSQGKTQPLWKGLSGIDNSVVTLWRIGDQWIITVVSPDEEQVCIFDGGNFNQLLVGGL